MNRSEEQLIVFSSKSWKGMVLLAVVVLGALAFGWLAVQWQIGNMLAELTSPNEPNASEVARVVKMVSPRDPMGSWLQAVTKADDFTAEKLAEAIEAHRQTVRLSPKHYPWWLELGRSYEQADRPDEAEKAFLQAVKLAPSYTLPRWQLGNFYLRAGREQEAFEELKKAAEKDPVYREQVFSITWDYFEQDTSRLDALVGNSEGMKVGLAKFYAARERPIKSVEIWRSLSDQSRESNRQVGALIAQAMFEKRFLKAAVEFSNSLQLEEGIKFEAIQNPGFEQEISRRDDAFFGWKTDSRDNVRVLLSRGEKHSGNRSLQVTFNGFSKAEFHNIYKTIALEPGASYRLGFWIRTEDLRSAGTPKLEVLSASEGKIVASTDPFASGTEDWKQVSVDFRVPDNSEGVVIRTARAYCGDNCPMFGTIWYDDFTIERIKDIEVTEEIDG
ncbi:MAG: tetratricopeptide repeat protein [Aridibacter famidurans]|nr:tetratricopeptide repeat protein [Aridibacter famidurans]